MQLSTNIRIRRRALNLTAEQLAKKLGYRSPQTVSMWETGKRSPPSGILPKIAIALDCKVGDLFTDSNTYNELVNGQSNNGYSEAHNGAAG